MKRLKGINDNKKAPEYNVHPEIRDEVMRFALAMEEKLRKNEHKTHWSLCPIGYLIDRMDEKHIGIHNAFRSHGLTCGPEELMEESAHLGNYAMMIYDNARRGE
jgi:hypothetical protein